MNRRNFLRSAAGLLIPAPFVVQAKNLMPVKQLAIPACYLHYLYEPYPMAGDLLEGVARFFPDASGGADLTVRLARGCRPYHAMVSDPGKVLNGMVYGAFLGPDGGLGGLAADFRQ